MSMTRAEALQLFLALYPPGYDQVMDTTPGTNFYKFAYASSGALKTYGSDVIDTLRTEINPGTCIQKLSDWESALGLRDTPIAQFGTTVQRRNAVLSWLRQSGSFSLDDIRSVVQPYFLYANPTQIEVIETSRSALQLLHQYVGPSITIPMNGYDRGATTVLDDPRTSHAGAIVYVSITSTNIEQLYFRLEAPDGAFSDVPVGALGVGAATADSFVLYFPDVAGAAIMGSWRLLAGCQGAAGGTVDAWVLFVEGLGANITNTGTRNGDGLGGAVFTWAVVADEDKLGQGYDLSGAIRSLRRLKPAHTEVALVFRPTGAATSFAIPNLRSATPDGAIPA